MKRLLKPWRNIQNTRLFCRSPIPPTKAEATPNDLLTWTNGKALLATGSPFEPVEFNGKMVPIAQSNNSYIFPGLGLGVIAAQAQRCTDGMISAACHALSEQSPVRHDKSATILPPLTDAFKSPAALLHWPWQNKHAKKVWRVSAKMSI